jgi:hypothetical protein
MTLSEHAINIILGAIFISVFIGIFFFTYVSKIEQNIVRNQTIYLVDNIIGDLDILLPDSIKLLLSSKLIAPDMSHEDAKVEENNNALKKKAIIALSIIFGVGILIAFLISWFSKTKILPIIGKNLILLVFVALTEFIFLIFIGQNYISVDPNYVKYKFIQTLQEELKYYYD